MSPVALDAPSGPDNNLTEESQHGADNILTKEDEQGASPSDESVQPKASERPQMSVLREIAFILTVCMAQLMTQAGQGQVIAPLRIIGASFGVDSDPAQLVWFAAAYPLTTGSFILIAGRLGDLYGHKKLFIIGFAWFGLWSILSGFAVYSGPIFFDCCRAFQGIGPALLLPNGIAILGTTYEPGMRKAMVFSAFGAMAPSGGVVGALFASLFAQLVWWPWAFWVMGMICLFLAGISMFLIPNAQPTAANSTSSIWERTDIAGCITGVSGLVLINFAWNQAPVVGWSKPYVYVLLIIGLISLAAFGQIEKRARFPLVPIASMTTDIGYVFACVACGWGAFGIWFYYTWQLMEQLRGISPLLATAQFSPATVTGLLASATTGFLFTRVPGSVLMMISMVAFCIGPILVATAPVHQTYWAQLFVAIFIMPFGMYVSHLLLFAAHANRRRDMSFPAATLLLSNSMPREHQGLSASLVATVINYSISISLGFAGTVEVHVNDGGKNLSRGYRGAWYMAIGLSGLGLAFAILYGLHQRWKSQAKKGLSNEQQP
jgi:MFS family permease